MYINGDLSDSGFESSFSDTNVNLELEPNMADEEEKRAKEELEKYKAKMEKDNAMAPLFRIKLRSYIDEDPNFWFNLVDHTFLQFGTLADEVKIANVVRYLPKEVALNLSDIIGAPGGTYESLRTRVCNVFGNSDESKIDQVLSGRQFTGKPSVILMEMKRLVGTKAASGESFIRRIWVSKLPPTIRRYLPIVAAEKPLDEVARIADQLFDEYIASLATETPGYAPPTQPTYASLPFSNTVPTTSLPATTVSALNTYLPGAQVSATTAQSETAVLREEVAKLANTVTDLVAMMKGSHLAPVSCDNYTCRSCCASVDSSHSQRRGRSPSPHPRRQDNRERSASRQWPIKFFDGKCYYHHVYGNEARSCRTNCTLFDPKLKIIDDTKN